MQANRLKIFNQKVRIIKFSINSHSIIILQILRKIDQVYLTLNKYKEYQIE
jgi:hypothetical protein